MSPFEALSPLQKVKLASYRLLCQFGAYITARAIFANRAVSYGPVTGFLMGSIKKLIQMNHFRKKKTIFEHKSAWCEVNQQEPCLRIISLAYMFWFSCLTDYLSISIEELDFMIFTAARHKGELLIFWLHLWVAVILSIFIYSIRAIFHAITCQLFVD